METTPLSTRAAMRERLAALVEASSAKYPDYATRIVKAAALILTGDVTLLADGTARVASETNPAIVYAVGSLCECADFTHATPPHKCKHTIALAFARDLYNKGLWANPDGSLPGEDDVMADDEYPPDVEDDMLPNAFPAPPPADRPAWPARDPQRLEATAPPQAARTGVDVPIIATILVKMRGRVFEVKLCDTDDVTLMQRVDRLLAQYPVDDQPPLPPQQGLPPAAPPPHEPTTGLSASQCVCPQHGQKKILPSKWALGGFHCGAKNPDDTWCTTKWNP